MGVKLSSFLKLSWAIILLGFRFLSLLLVLSFHKRRAARSFKKALVAHDVPEHVASVLTDDYKSAFRFSDILRFREAFG